MPVEFTRRFIKQYSRLPGTIQRRVDKALGFLDEDFHHPGVRGHPLAGARELFEAYVDHKYRMTFERRGNLILMRNADNHDDCLNDP